MALAVVQRNVNTSTGSASPTCTWNAATVAGNLLILVIATAGDTSAPTITPGGSWVNVDATNFPKYPGTPSPQIGMWYIANAASQSGTQTFTLGAAKDAMCCLIEVSGAATSTPVDKTANNGSTAGTTTIDSGTTAATGTADEYWLAVGCNRNSANTPGAASGSPTPNFTPTTGTNPGTTGNASTPSAIGYALADQIKAVTGTANTTWSLGSARPWTGIVATFKIAAAVGLTYDQDKLRTKLQAVRVASIW